MRWLLASTAVSWVLGLWSAFQAVRHPGLLRTPMRLLFAAVYAATGLLLGSVFMLLHFFDAFSNETLVAQVVVTRMSPPAFELTYTPATAGGEPQDVQLEGDQWAVSGGIIKWHPWLTALGLKSYHRPMRLSGQFSRVADQRSHLPTVYPLESDLLDRFWEAFYWADPRLSFVEAVYGSSAYVYVQRGVVEEIYVTPSGYLIKSARQEQAARQPRAPVLK